MLGHVIQVQARGRGLEVPAAEAPQPNAQCRAYAPVAQVGHNAALHNRSLPSRFRVGSVRRRTQDLVPLVVTDHSPQPVCTPIPRTQNVRVPRVCHDELEQFGQQVELATVESVSRSDIKRPTFTASATPRIELWPIFT